MRILVMENGIACDPKTPICENCAQQSGTCLEVNRRGRSSGPARLHRVVRASYGARRDWATAGKSGIYPSILPITGLWVVGSA
jgi:hypothetical protein